MLRPGIARAAPFALEPGMTREQVQTLFGLPDGTSMEVCGSEAQPKPRPWDCLIWRYGPETRGLRYAPVVPSVYIFFERVKGRWVVNSWRS